ncbi:MAG: TetR/AcrR family transcriptional regulator [Flavipsychrobacter sp.]|nr:TetR/AcrR family transcriptional regulator [Flavipsychrobacter sp.]
MEITGKQLAIMETAEQLFADNGYDGTSIRDIAHQADVNVAMISYYFGSKEKLLQAIFEKRTELWRVHLESMIEDKSRSPMEKMFVLIDNYMQKIFDQSCFHRIMAQQQMANQDSPVASLILDTKRRNQDLVKKLVQQGQRSGDFKKNIDVPLLMMTMMGTINQLITTQHHYRELNNLQDLDDTEYKKHIKKKLSTHLKSIFKAILSNEE